MNLSDKTAMIFDNGLFQPLAHRIAKDFGRVLYHRGTRHAFPVPNDSAIGGGYQKVERAGSWEEHIDEVDLFVFPDLYWSQTQAYLRSLGHRVFGCGWGEELELWRDDFYSTLKKNGLNTVPWEMVQGMTALREHLEGEEDKYIKVSYHRGLCETFRWIDQRISKPRLDVLQHDLGALSEDQWFLVQDSLDSKREVGSDQIIVDGRFPKTVQYAVEGKDKTGLARMLPYARLPKEVLAVNDKLAPVFASSAREHSTPNPYRGFFSTEIRVAKDGKPYLTDPTCRMASPCGETYMLMSDNFSEMIWAAAEGEIVEPAVKNTFAAQAMIQADLAETQSIPIFIDPKVRDQVCLFHSGIRGDGQECVFKSDAAMLEIGSVIGLGATIDAAIEDCRAVAGKVVCDKMSVAVDALEEFKPQLMKL
jgi:hypothetical protein